MKAIDLIVRLEKIGVSDPKGEAFLILNHLFGISHSDMLISRDREYDDDEIMPILEKREARAPIQHILGKWFFMDVELVVSEHCLIPRPDTEILVYEAIRLLKSAGSVADLCTGSGCIGLSMLKHRPDISRMTLVDISTDALEIAGINAKALGLTERCALCHGDITKDIVGGPYDMIVSNPPYIPSADVLELSDEVKKEPLIALDGGADGLDIVRSLIDKAPDSLNENGYLLIEFGYDQGDKIKQIMEKKLTHGAYKAYKILKDYSGNDRVLVAQA